MHKPEKLKQIGSRSAAPTSRAALSRQQLHDGHLYDRLPELHLIYDTAPVGLAFLSLDCRYVHINQRLTEICGISVADHIGRSVRETVPAVAEQVEQLVQAIVHTGEPVTGVEVRGQKADKSNADHVWITNWHPLRNADGRIIGINVVAEDITERKRSEAALRELNETLEQRVQAETYERLQTWNVSQDLLVIADADGKFLNVNPAWTATLGWPETDLIGKTLQWMLHPDDRDKCARRNQTARRGSHDTTFPDQAAASGRIVSLALLEGSSRQRLYLWSGARRHRTQGCRE